jgi:hypothetical protein
MGKSVKTGQKKTIGPEHQEHVHHHGKKSGRFTELLLQWMKDRRPKVSKLHKEMTEDELKARKTERNRRRKMRLKVAKKAKIAKHSLGNKKPTPNTCRRRRLAAKHPERKWESK